MYEAEKQLFYMIIDLNKEMVRNDVVDKLLPMIQKMINEKKLLVSN